MRLLDFLPTQSTYLPGQLVMLEADVECDRSGECLLELTIHHLAERVYSHRFPFTARKGRQQFHLTWQPPQNNLPAGYGATLVLEEDSGIPFAQAHTAFDVLPAWTAFPRYGFLCDFAPGRTDAGLVMQTLTGFQINGLQFYDWQYRHDNLVPPTEAYTDPLGRSLSLNTIKALIQAAHSRGMAAMPYLAIYAASAAFWKAHPEWNLCDKDGKPIPFGEDFLGLMNPTPGSPWAEHLQQEGSRTLAELPFDGLHIDQYGEPHEVWDEKGNPVDLPAAFCAFIGEAKARHPQKAVVFNAVGNWPVEALAASQSDFNYIEIWPPSTHYEDVVNIVRNARRLSGNKGVVIALYLPADRPLNNRLADALIYAAGGSRIELGENARLLADPYFPKHQELSHDLRQVLRRYAGFAVRYGELTGPCAADADDVDVTVPKGIWALPRRRGNWTAVHLVNGRGLDNPQWDQPHPAPQEQRGLAVSLKGMGAVREAYWASPDLSDPALQPLSFTRQAEEIHLTVPSLSYWTTLFFETNAGVE